jgi:peptide/nickel transport system permease protein
MVTHSRTFRIACHAGLRALPSAIGVVVLSFVLLQLAPGDVVDVIAGEAGGGSAETNALMRHEFGLDRALPERLLAYLSQLAQGNLGVSPRYGVPVSQLIWERLPSTVLLASSAMLVAVVVGIALGAVMAFNQGRWPDRLLSVLTQIFQSVPSFWVALMLVVIFSVKLGWLPSNGYQTVGLDAGGFAALADRLRYMLLPTVSLAMFYIAIYSRLTRVSVIEAKRQDYVRTARAKGISEWRVMTRHVLRNALLPVATVAGVHVGGILGGSVVVETVFGWPGLGRLAYDAVMGRDFLILLGILLFSALLVILANALVDILHGVLDPRVGRREGARPALSGKIA